MSLQTIIIILFLGLLAGGAGFFRAGKPERFVIPTFCMLVFLLLSGWSGFMGQPGFCVAFYLLLLATLALIIAGVLHFTKKPPENKKWYSRWYSYLAWIFILLAVKAAHAVVPFAGYTSFETHAEAMAPALSTGDVFVLDVNAYKSVPPAVHDVVLYKPPENGKFYIQRVTSAAPDGALTLSVDNPTIPPQPAAAANVAGKALYVLYSPRLSSIGRVVN